MLTDNTAVKLSKGTKPTLATWPETSAIRIGTAELIGRFPAHHHVGKIGQRSRDDEIGLAHPQSDRLDGPIALVFPILLGGIAADADHALSGLVAETVGDLATGRGRLQG